MGDELVITPPQPLLDEIERLGSDPRRPRTAIARWASTIWLDAVIDGQPAETLEASQAEKETMERSHPLSTALGVRLHSSPNGRQQLRQRQNLHGVLHEPVHAPPLRSTPSRDQPRCVGLRLSLSLGVWLP